MLQRSKDKRLTGICPDPGHESFVGCCYFCRMTEKTYTGGCLCGALRYEAWGEPVYTGHCYCGDCRKTSGSGFIGFMGFPASAVTFTGERRQFASTSFRGTPAVRNFCPTCGGLVFGGTVGVDNSHTIYAGSLDDPSRFRPKMAIFVREKAPWVAIPEGLAVFEGLPGR
jgi:hypothetical protein